MERINITYSVPKHETTEVLVRLIESSQGYLEEFSKVLDDAQQLIITSNPEGCIKALAQSRDLLADADFRLHDAMNMVIQLVRHEQKSQPTVPPEQDQVLKAQQPEQPDKLDKVRDRMAQVKKNIDDLGIEIPEKELDNIMGRLNDQASRGV